MFARLPRLFWIECLLAAANALVLGLMVLSPQWIETALGIDPDDHGGLTEQLLAGALAASTLLFSWAARRHWRGAGQSGQ